LDKRGVALKVIDQNIDISDATERLLFNMLSAIAQFETELRAERQMDGITKALARGVRFGRKHALTPAEVTTLRQQRAAGVRIKDLMHLYGLTKASVYRYLGGTQRAAMPEMALEHRSSIHAACRSVCGRCINTCKLCTTAQRRRSNTFFRTPR
jgi:DNA invertase Pin-like site-specific DNA recombinase